MKAEDIIKEDEIDEEACDCCSLHEKAYEILKDEILCPKCNKPLKEGGAGYGGFIVVGEANFYDKCHNIGKYPIYHCDNCGEDYRNLYALMPIPITWNANHDIFYTGGRVFLTEDTEKLRKKAQEKILPTIMQFVERKYGGETLTPQQLMYWIQGDIEHVIAEFLFENGYKK